VKQFVQTAGKGVVKRLILDRGFLDGEEISLCKKEYGIDILIPIRRNMEIYADAMALFRQSDVDWMECKPPETRNQEPLRLRPKAVSTREQKRQEKTPPVERATAILTARRNPGQKGKRPLSASSELDSCTVPLTVGWPTESIMPWSCKRSGF